MQLSHLSLNVFRVGRCKSTLEVYKFKILKHLYPCNGLAPLQDRYITVVVHLTFCTISLIVPWCLIDFYYVLTASWIFWNIVPFSKKKLTLRQGSEIYLLMHESHIPCYDEKREQLR